MIHLTKGNTDTIYFTGTENADLVNPYFLFAFTSRISEQVVKVMITNTSEVDRYDKGVIVVDTYFTDKPDGLWKYEIYEKADDEDMTLTGTIVETGFMYLHPEVPFAPTEYSEQTNTFTVYEQL